MRSILSVLTGLAFSTLTLSNFATLVDARFSSGAMYVTALFATAVAALLAMAKTPVKIEVFGKGDWAMLAFAVKLMSVSKSGRSLVDC